MAVTTTNPSEQKRLRRIKELLVRLASYSDLRAACLLGLTDTETPHPKLGAAGLTLSASGTTRQLFDYSAPKLGKTRLDRELRDEVWPRLRELGIVQRSYVLSAKEAVSEGRLIEYGVHRRAKSPNNSYAITDEARQLLDTPDDQWGSALDTFAQGDADRRMRVLQQEASAGATESDHSKLIRAAVDALKATRLNDYELVFVDDEDETRVKDEWEEPLASRGLRPDLESLWPDAILVRDSDRSIWFVDAVTTDGEVDTTRHRELDAWARERGYTPTGYTTAYATWQRAGSRQKKMKNLAVGSTMWVAEDGGKLFGVESLADGE